MRTIKVLGMALVAMLAVGAVSASAALGVETFKTTDSTSPVTLTGTQDTSNVFAIPEGSTSCGVTTFVATGATNGSSAVTGIVPTITNCKSLGFPATVTTNGCTYTLRINAANTNGTVDLVCPAGQEITVTAVAAGTDKCIIHIEPQTGLGVVKYTNIGSGTTSEITIDLELEKIKYKTTKGTGVGTCAETTTTAGATIKGSILVTAELPGTNTHEGIFVS